MFVSLHLADIGSQTFATSPRLLGPDGNLPKLDSGSHPPKAGGTAPYKSPCYFRNQGTLPGQLSPSRGRILPLFTISAEPFLFLSFSVLNDTAENISGK